MGVAFSYPSGPSICEGISGQCPKIQSAANTGLIVLYSIWGFIAVYVVLFALYRTILGKRNRKGEIKGGYTPNPEYGRVKGQSTMDSSDALNEKQKKTGEAYELQGFGNVDDLDMDTASDNSNKVDRDRVRLEGYLGCWVGTIGYWLVNLVTFGWLCIIAAINFDKYVGCELKGIDSFCFFGKYMLFGGYDTNSEYYFAVWCFCVVWLFGLLCLNGKLRNYFRIPCVMEKADYVYIWTRDEKEIIEMPHVSKLLKVVKRLEERFTPKSMSEGHDNTYRVEVNEAGMKYFVHDGTRFLYDPDYTNYVTLQIDSDTPFTKFHNSADGITTELAHSRLQEHGPNAIPFKPASIIVLLTNEFCTLFYYYQFIMYFVWIWMSYMFIALVEISVVVFSALINVYIQYNNEHTIAELTKHNIEVSVLRDGQKIKLNSTDLVPGDVVAVDEKVVVPCDMILISGNSLVNESSLTGESKPVQKTACPREAKIYDPEKGGSKHTLFSGTTVLQNEPTSGGKEVFAVVTSTGINTSKGKLISKILYPEKTSFRYEEELKIVFLILSVFAVINAVLSIYFQSRTSSSTWITKWSYAIITVSRIMNPLLPVALKIGQIKAGQRLKEKGVFCINPGRIAISGKIRVFCFDKTGTLTQDGMKFSGVVPVSESTNQFKKLTNNFSTETPELFLNGLATCHALTKFGEDEIVGNEVETNMFKGIKWKLGGTDSNGVATVSSPAGNVIEIFRKFEFSHELQTMSVIAKSKNSPDSDKRSYVKGSFEKIKGLCLPESVPADYDSTAKQFALDGSYVLAMAEKSINIDEEGIADLKREELEVKETYRFMGLLIFRNEPKEDTKDAIIELRAGDVRPVMITGDNAQCGQYISNVCQLVDEGTEILLAEMSKTTKEVQWSFMRIEDNKTYYTTEQVMAMIQENGNLELGLTGNSTLDDLVSSQHIYSLLMHLRIFARMSPESKILVVNLFRKQGLIVGMCGDGGNDCGALRAAQAGMALSDAEASIVSPFTSKSKSVQSVVDLLKEGRASLHTSFAVYKFLIYYGQIFSIVLLVTYWYGVVMCMCNYLMIDFFAIVFLGYTMTLSDTSKKLANKRPTSSLIGKINLVSSVGTYFITFLGMITCLLIMTYDTDYVPWPAQYAGGADWWLLGDNFESTTVYCSMYLSLVSQSVIHSFGYKYRSAVWFNWPLMLCATSLFLITSLVVLLPSNDFTNLWHIASYQFNGANPNGVWLAWQTAGNPPSPPMSFTLRFTIWIVTCVFILLSAAWQGFVVEGFVGSWLRKKYPSNRREIIC